ncbi:MAG: hypothetical protein Q8Q20_04390 [bacterium]|nr:hypothetical protein [bacterium]
MPEPKAHPKFIRLFYFWAGIIATLAYRIIIVLNNYSAYWVTISWYIGTIGFIIYFIHRYQISEKRARLIREQKLDEKVSSLTQLSEDDKASLGYILRTLKTTREKWNYVFIFITSGLALLIGLILDFT